MGKLLAIVVILATLVAIAVLALRPGTVIGVSDGVLAESIARAQDIEKAGKCKGRDHRRTCTTQQGTIEVKIDRFGCWEPTAGRGRKARGAQPPANPAGELSGCVTIVDLLNS